MENSSEKKALQSNIIAEENPDFSADATAGLEPESQTENTAEQFSRAVEKAQALIFAFQEKIEQELKPVEELAEAYSNYSWYPLAESYQPPETLQEQLKVFDQKYIDIRESVEFIKKDFRYLEEAMAAVINPEANGKQWAETQEITAATQLLQSIFFQFQEAQRVYRQLEKDIYKIKDSKLKERKFYSVDEVSGKIISLLKRKDEVSKKKWYFGKKKDLKDSEREIDELNDFFDSVLQLDPGEILSGLKKELKMIYGNINKKLSMLLPAVRKNLTDQLSQVQDTDLNLPEVEFTQAEIEEMASVQQEKSKIYSLEDLAKNFESEINLCNTVLGVYMHESAQKLNQSILPKNDSQFFQDEKPATIQELLKSVNLVNWQIFVQLPVIRKKYGIENLDFVSGLMERAVIDNLSSRTNSDQQLDKFFTPGLAPFQALNLLKPRLSIKKLWFELLNNDEAVRQAAEKYPELKDILEIIKDNPETYDDPQIENPIYGQIKQEQVKLAARLLKQEPGTTPYILHQLLHVDGSWQPLTEALKEIIQDKKKFDAVGKTLIDRACQKPEEAKLILKIILSSKNSDSISNEKIYGLIIFAMMDDFDQEIVSQAPKYLNKEKLESTIHLVRGLRDAGLLKISGYNLMENIFYYEKAAQAPGFIDMIKKFVSFGYTFQISDAEKLTELNENEKLFTALKTLCPLGYQFNLYHTEDLLKIDVEALATEVREIKSFWPEYYFNSLTDPKRDLANFLYKANQAVDFDDPKLSGRCKIILLEAFLRYGADNHLKNELESLRLSNEEIEDSQAEVLEQLREKIFVIKPSDYQEWAEIIDKILPPKIGRPDAVWGPAYRKISKLQAKSERSEHNPWRTELDPLVKQVIEKEILDPHEPKDGKILQDFVNEYGMYNLPTIFSWHTALSRANKVADMPEQIRQEIAETLKINLDRITDKNVISQEIKLFTQVIKRAMLDDSLTAEMIKSNAGLELFLMLRGSSRWSHNDDPRELMEDWAKTIALHPELGELPEGYQPVEIRVASVSKKDLSQADQQESNLQIEKILKNPELIPAIERLRGVYLEAFGIDNLNDWWQKKQERALATLDESQEKIKLMLNRTEDEWLNLIAQEQDLKVKEELKKKQKTIASPNGRQGLIKQLSFLDNQKQQIQAFILPTVDPNEDDFEPKLVEIMDVLNRVLPEKFNDREQTLQILSAFHIRQIMEPGQKELINNLLTNGGREQLTEDEVAGWRQHLHDYLVEHYFNPEQDINHTGHTKFNENLLNNLSKIWGLKKFKENIVYRKDDEIKALVDSEYVLDNSMVKINLVPSRGALRIFSGDIGDACFTSKHKALAQGEYPSLTAFTMVTGQGTKNERLAGSVLAIETTAPDGDKVLLIRANNPQENLIQRVSDEDLLEKMLEQFKALAVKRGIEHVVVPLDPASNSCSNRQAVASYYRTHFKDRPPLFLINEPVTNFNNYNNWDAKGSHKVVKIN